MKKQFIPEGLFLLVLALLFVMKSIAPEKLAITGSFQTRSGEDKVELKMTKSNSIASVAKEEKEDQQ